MVTFAFVEPSLLNELSQEVAVGLRLTALKNTFQTLCSFWKLIQEKLWYCGQKWEESFSFMRNKEIVFSFAFVEP